MSDDTIKVLQSDLREVTVEREAVVHAVDYEGLNQDGSRRRKSAGDNPQMARKQELSQHSYGCVLNKG